MLTELKKMGRWPKNEKRVVIMKMYADWELDGSDDLVFYEHIEEYRYPDSRYYRKNKKAHSLHCDGREQKPYTLKNTGLH